MESRPQNPEFRNNLENVHINGWSTYSLEISMIIKAPEKRCIQIPISYISQ